MAVLELHLGIPGGDASTADRVERIFEHLGLRTDAIFDGIYLLLERNQYPPFLRRLLAGLESSGASVIIAPGPRRPEEETPLSPEKVPSAWRRVKKVMELGPRLRLIGTYKGDDPAFGKAMHAFFTADDFRLPFAHSLALAHRLLDAGGAGSVAPPEALVEASARLQALIQRQWPGSRVWRELPLRSSAGGSLVFGTADLVIETCNDLHLVEHKSFPGRKDLCLQWAAAASPQLMGYAEILERATGKPCRTLYVHFPFPGIIVKLA
jgi:hypothetical protein